MGSADREYMKDVAADYMPLPLAATLPDSSKVASLEKTISELTEKNKEFALSLKASAERISKLEAQLKAAVSEANRLQSIIFAPPPMRDLAKAVHILVAAMRIIPFESDANDLYRRIFIGAITLANESLRKSGSLCDVPSHELARQIMVAYFSQCTEREKEWHVSQGHLTTPISESAQ